MSTIITTIRTLKTESLHQRYVLGIGSTIEPSIHYSVVGETITKYPVSVVDRHDGNIYVVYSDNSEVSYPWAGPGSYGPGVVIQEFGYLYRYEENGYSISFTYGSAIID